MGLVNQAATTWAYRRHFVRDPARRPAVNADVGKKSNVVRSSCCAGFSGRQAMIVFAAVSVPDGETGAAEAASVFDFLKDCIVVLTLFIFLLEYIFGGMFFMGMDDRFQTLIY